MRHEHKGYKKRAPRILSEKGLENIRKGHLNLPKQSKETIDNRIKKCAGRKRTEEQKQRMRHPHKPMSEQGRKNISEAKRKKIIQ